MSFGVSCGLAPVLHGGFPDRQRSFILRRVAEIADDAGFEVLWVEDHTRLPPLEIRASEGQPGQDEPLEAWATLSYLAATTKRVRLGTEVTPVTMRHPALLAKTAATLDQLSGGRVILGVGTGWFKEEYLSLGIPFEPKKQRFEKAAEAIEVIRQLWTQPVVDYSGSFYSLKGAFVAPKPVQTGGPPMWFGGFSDQLLSMLVRFGDGWILGTNPSPDFVCERWHRLREMAEEAGTDAARIRVAVPLLAHLSEDRQRAVDSLNSYVNRGNFDAWLGSFFGEGARNYGIYGTPEDALERLKPYLAIGIRNFIFDLRPPSIMVETAELLALEVLPRLADV